VLLTKGANLDIRKRWGVTGRRGKWEWEDYDRFLGLCLVFLWPSLSPFFFVARGRMVEEDALSARGSYIYIGFVVLDLYPFALAVHLVFVCISSILGSGISGVREDCVAG